MGQGSYTMLCIEPDKAQAEVVETAVGAVPTAKRNTAVTGAEAPTATMERPTDRR